MKRRPCPVVSGILAVTAAGGCTTTAADVIQGRPDGLVRVYSIPSERAWRAARAVLDAAGATTIEERRDESLMLTLTTVGAAGFVLPTRVAVWIEPVDRGTRLTVVSAKSAASCPVRFSEAEFHQAFARQLEETPKVRRGLVMNARVTQRTHRQGSGRAIPRGSEPA